MAVTNDTATPAGFWRRVSAKFCDWILVFAGQLLVMTLFALLDAFRPQKVASVLGMFALLLALQIAYFGIGQANGRRTLGYHLAGLRVETLAGQTPSLGRSLWRSLLSNLASALLIYGGLLNFIGAFFKPRKRTGHDFTSKTRVVQAEQPRIMALWSAPALFCLLVALWSADVIFPSLRAYYIPSGTMENTLKVNDRLLVNLLTYRLRAPRSGEIVVFQAPDAALPDSPDSITPPDFIKRIVGTPGQTVEIIKGQLKRDGALISEPFALWENENAEFPGAKTQLFYDLKIVDGEVYSRDYYGSDPGPWMQKGEAINGQKQRKVSAAKPGKVPPNCYLMLGDHRSNSNDSHVWGFVRRENFHGPAMNTFWPEWRNLR